MAVSRPTPVVPELAIVEPSRVAPPKTDNPRVRVYPSANGTVLLVGVTLAGAWVAEYRCLVEDLDERCIVAMERRVRVKERKDRPGPRLI